MKNRRAFLKAGAGLAATGVGLLLSPVWSGVRWAFAETKKIILPKGTRMDSLISKNPANLDTRNLETIPLKEFGTMGLSNYRQALSEWRLDITGAVGRPLRLTYQQIRDLPGVERKVLLICPGFFANYGLWKGISMPELLKSAGVKDKATHVRFSGPEGTSQKVEQFPIEAVRANQIFLAYGVNGKRLPIKHGFPLRLVAEGHYGYNWVKYVDKVELISVA
jgi:DMSO/TMAO reductase YedYZ molybdopterin-dependent catalytic subunit